MKTINHTQRKHSRISPSGLKTLQTCPAYESDNKESAASRRGTKLHEIMDSGIIPEDLDGHDREVASSVLEILRETEAKSEYESLKEIKLDYTSLGLKDFEQGHADRVIILEVGKDENPTHVELIDFKFGSWEVDHVSINIQFRAYAAGLFLMFPSINKIRVRLIQPELQKDESHTFIRERDYDLIINQIASIVKRRHRWLETRDDAMLKPSESICGFCARQAECTAWQKHMSRVANDADLFGHDIVPLQKFETPELADPDEVMRAFRWVKPMEDYLKKFKKFVLAVYDTGRIDSGLTLVEKPGDTTIVDPIAAARVLEEQYGVTLDEFLSACDISITKLKQLVASHAKTGEKTEAQSNAINTLDEMGLIQYGPKIRYIQLSRKKS